jgi:hypothetical protein
MWNPFALLPPEIAAACGEAIAMAVEDYRVWATQQFDLIEQAEGSGPTARNARQYLKNGRGARVFLKREVAMTAKAVTNALAGLAKNTDSLSAIMHLELARCMHVDAGARYSARGSAGSDFDEPLDDMPNRRHEPPDRPTGTVADNAASLRSPTVAPQTAGRTGASVLDRLAQRRALKARGP